MYEWTLSAPRHKHVCALCGSGYHGPDLALCQLHQGPICPRCCHEACHLAARPELGSAV